MFTGARCQTKKDRPPLEAVKELNVRSSAYFFAAAAACCPATLPKVRLIWIDVPEAG